MEAAASETVVLSISDEVLTDRLAELRSMGLLRDCLVIDPLVEDGLDELVQQLTTTRIREMSFVVLATEQSSSERRADGDERIYDELRQICADGRIELTAGVVGGVEREAAMEACSFRADWDYNLQVVPNDGLGVAGFTPAPLDSEGIATAILLVAALAAGLVVGDGRGFGSRLKPQLDGSEPFVRYCQSFLRVVDCGQLAEDVSHLALRSRVPWPQPENLSAHPHPDGEVERLVQELSVEHGFGLKSLPALPEGEVIALGWREALRVFLKRGLFYAKTAAARQIAGIFERTLAAIETVLQRNTFGADADLVISLQIAPDSAELLTESGSRIAAIEALPEVEAYARQADPRAWRALRSVLFGLADGGDFAGSMAGNEPTARQERAVLGDHSIIAADPASTLEVPQWIAESAGLGSDPLELRPHDVRACAILDKASQRLRVDADDDEGDVEEDVDEWAASTGDWRADNERSLCWKLAERVSTGEFAALDHLRWCSDRYSKLPAEIGEAVEDFNRSRGELLRALIGTIVGVVALIVAALAVALASDSRSIVGFPGTDDLAQPSFWLALLALPVAGIGFGRLLRAVRGCFEAERTLVYLSRLPDSLLERRRAAAAEANRLADLYAQIIDWADICGGIIHRPFGTGSDERPPDCSAADPPQRMIVVGSASRNDAAVSRLSLQLRRKVAAPGWLGRMYEKIERLFRDDYEAAVALFDDDSDPDLDVSIEARQIDLPGADRPYYSPRAQLREEVLAESFLDQLYSLERDALVSGVEAHEWASTLMPIRAEKISSKPIPADRFFGALVENDASVAAGFPRWCFPDDDPNQANNSRIAERISGSHLSSGSGTESALALDVDRTVLLSYRVDVSAQLRVSETTLIRPCRWSGQEQPRNSRGPAGYV